jgi:hypothetical protein
MENCPDFRKHCLDFHCISYYQCKLKFEE